MRVRGTAFGALGDDASAAACLESALASAAEQGLFMQQVGALPRVLTLCLIDGSAALLA